jgi:hypothetical protein
VKDIPIIFSEPMVLALLAGRKTMTRRLLWSKREPGKSNLRRTTFSRWDGKTQWARVKPGDRLWVREAFAGPVLTAAGGDLVERVYYLATDDPGKDHRGKAIKGHPSIHLPRSLSRLTLVVTATKIERLQDISEADAQAEGADRDHSVRWPDGDPGTITDVRRRNFARLWRVLHGPLAWTENPEVVALTFAVHKQNIDAMARAA